MAGHRCSSESAGVVRVGAPLGVRVPGLVRAGPSSGAPGPRGGVCGRVEVAAKAGAGSRCLACLLYSCLVVA